MKSFAVAALIAITTAQPVVPTYGEGCKADPTVCDASGNTCVQWFDTEDYPRFTCEDCVGSNRDVTDEYGTVQYFCPGEEMEGAQSLYYSAATLAAVVAMMY